MDSIRSSPILGRPTSTSTIPTPPLQTDIESAGHELFPRLARAARVARILGLEVAAIIALAPYGAYAMSVYR